jgi:hypothetical protein
MPESLSPGSRFWAMGDRRPPRRGGCTLQGPEPMQDQMGKGQESGDYCVLVGCVPGHAFSRTPSQPGLQDRATGVGPAEEEGCAKHPLSLGKTEACIAFSSIAHRCEGDKATTSSAKTATRPTRSTTRTTTSSAHQQGHDRSLPTHKGTTFQCLDPSLQQRMNN